MPNSFSVPKHNSDGSKTYDLAAIATRLILSLVMFYYNILHQLQLAWANLWENTEWNLASQFEAKGIPAPTAMSITLVCLILLLLLGILIGLFTRINSLLLIAVLGFVLLVPLDLSTTLNPQAIVLYAALCLTLAIAGPGRASLDYYFASRKAKRLEL